VPTSSTTDATHRSSGLAPVSSSAEPAPSSRAFSGVPLLPEIPQSSSPPHRVALVDVPDPPRHRPTPESSRPPPLRPTSDAAPSPASTWAAPTPVLGRTQCCASGLRACHTHRSARQGRGLRALCKRTTSALWTWATRYCEAGPLRIQPSGN
jgi:hypothetical protein